MRKAAGYFVMTIAIRRYLPNDVCATFAKEKSKANARKVSEKRTMTTDQTGKAPVCLQMQHRVSTGNVWSTEATA